ncbi:glycerol-3-phosphate responsive antiterminator, partial [Staphylococcus hominis]|uniref:glycerol-3-phosphate responsive antiterminator n=1 Tax=Staphylococcus hominis TaxID=1290 RepID=UPI0011A11A4F
RIPHHQYPSQYIIQTYKPKPILSTKTKLIQKPKSLNLLTIFTLFIIHTQPLNPTIQLINKLHPHYLQLLPPIAHKIVQNLRQPTTPKIIAAALIQ